MTLFFLLQVLLLDTHTLLKGEGGMLVSFMGLARSGTSSSTYREGNIV